MDIRQGLRQLYLCSELDDPEMGQLESIVAITHIEKGSLLFFQGDPAEGFYALVRGQIRIYKSSPDGKEYTLHIIHPGQMFAEAAIFGIQVFPANCIALENSTVIFFPRAKFIQLIKNSPQISLKMISALSGFVREFNQQIEDLSLKEVSARLAAYLLKEQEKLRSPAIILDISKGELANMLGTVNETLSRNLKKLRELGIIDVSGRTIKILNSNRLRDIAGGEKI